MFHVKTWTDLGAPWIVNILSECCSPSLVITSYSCLHTWTGKLNLIFCQWHLIKKSATSYFTFVWKMSFNNLPPTETPAQVRCDIPKAFIWLVAKLLSVLLQTDCSPAFTFLKFKQLEHFSCFAVKDLMENPPERSHGETLPPSSSHSCKCWCRSRLGCKKRKKFSCDHCWFWVIICL